MKRILALIMLLNCSALATTVHGPFTAQIIDTNNLGFYDQVVSGQNFSEQVCHDAARNLTYWVEMDKTDGSGNWINRVHKFDHATGIDTSVVAFTTVYGDVHLHAGIVLTPNGSIAAACEKGDAETPHPSLVEIRVSAAGGADFVLKKTSEVEYSYPHGVRFGSVQHFTGFLFRGTQQYELSLFRDQDNNGESWYVNPHLILALQLTHPDLYITTCGATDRIRCCVHNGPAYTKIHYFRSPLVFDFDGDEFFIENISGSNTHNILYDNPVLEAELDANFVLREAPSGCSNTVNCIAVTPDTGRELFLIEQNGTTKTAFLGWYADSAWHELEISAFTVADSRPYKIYPYSETVIDVYGVFSGICKRLRTVNGGNTWSFIEDLNEDYNVSYIALAAGAGVEDELVIAAAYLNNGTDSADVLFGHTSDTIEASEPKKNNSFDWFNF